MNRMLALLAILWGSSANAALVGDVSVPDENAVPITATCATTGCFGDYIFADSSLNIVGHSTSLRNLPLFFDAVSVDMGSDDELALAWSDSFSELTIFQAAWGTAELAGGGFVGAVNSVSLSFDSGVTWYEVPPSNFVADTVATTEIVNVSDGGSFEGAHYAAWHSSVNLPALTGGVVANASDVLISGDNNTGCGALQPDNCQLDLVGVVHSNVLSSYELSPNPNPGQNTITIAGGDIANNNSEPFENLGAIIIQDGGTLRNITEMDILIDEDAPGAELATIEIQSGGMLETLPGSVMNFDSVSHFDVSGTVNNSGSIRADWSFQLLIGSQFNNFGDVQNKQGSSLRGTVDNSGFFGNVAPANDSAGFMQQVGQFTNQQNATLLNQGEFINFSTIDNHGSIRNEVFITSGIGRGIF